MVLSALLTAAIVAAQDTQPAINSYIDLVQSAAGVINSANSRDAATRTTSSSSAPSTPAAATSAAATTPPPAQHGSNNKTLIIAVVCGVVGALLLGLILLGLCCCLMRRRKRRNRHVRTPSPVSERESKSWKANQPDNPGRKYAPLSSQGQVLSMSEHPTTPMAAYNGGPQLEQHPAYRPENPFVPVPPSPRRTHHQSNPSYATDATIAPYAPTTTDPEKQPLAARSRSNSPYRPSTGSSGLPTHAGPERPPTPFGLMGAGAAGAAAGAAGVAAAKHHDQHRQEPTTAHRRSHDPIVPAATNRSSGPSPTASTDRSAGYTGTAPLGRDVPVPAQQPYRPNSGGPQYNVPIPIQQSRKPVPSGASHNEASSPQNVPAPRSQGGVPDTRNPGTAGSRQPYTSIGEPYNDMHVHVLQNSAPSRTLQHSPPPAAGLNPAMTTAGSNLSAPYSTPYDPPAPVGTKIPRYSTPPQVPSRSPRRSVQHDSDGEIYDSTTASSSENGWQPSYAPAVSTEHSSSPHSSMQTPRGSHGSGSTFPRNSSGQNVRFSNSPTLGNTTSVGPPPPVPWDTEERRYSPNASPRGSGTYDRRSGQYERSRADSYTGNGNGMGKRTSHSPATSINGQPRRLRFSDLQATEQPSDWETRRFNAGVGEAL